MNLFTFCKNFYSARFLPITLFEDGQEVFSIGYPGEKSPASAILNKLEGEIRNPAVITTEDSGIYGILFQNYTNSVLVIGPAFTQTVSETSIKRYLKNVEVTDLQPEEIEQFFRYNPHYSYSRFLNLMVFLYQVINDEEINVSEHFISTDEGRNVKARQTNEAYEARDEDRLHGTYFFEQQLLDYVRRGKTDELKNFLLSYAQNRSFEEGKLSDNALRQAKDIFIGLVTIVGKQAAIPGGLDIEQTYQLIDTYIQECEYQMTVESVISLQFNMLMDFTNRVASVNIPKDLSNEITMCIQYIHSHINLPIQIDDIARYIGRSRSHLTTAFRAQTGKSINEYITDSRIEEACSLLKYSSRSISEISEYLCFSSQPYFTNVFKKYTGTTPAQYRRQINTITEDKKND